MSPHLPRLVLLVAVLVAGCKPAAPEASESPSPHAAVEVAPSSAPTTAPTDGTWLDRPADGRAETSWNQPGAQIPRAPKDTQPANTQPPAPDELRPQTPEEKAVADAGWKLDQPSIQKGTLTVVQARTGDADSMGRPHHMQAFVFSNGRYAGTLSPVATMTPRTDGALDVVEADDAQHLRAVYSRFKADDGLCCPSRESRASFVVKARNGAPVVTLERVETIANPAAQ